MADIGLSAFSLFFMQSESFLSHQRRLEQGYGTSNCHTLFGMKKIPTDNYIRLMLDPVWPEALQPCFDQVIEQLRERDGLKAFQRLAGRTLVALDGTEKQDCERNGAKRWLSAHAQRVAPLRPVYLGDALFSCQSLAEAVLETGADFLFVCKKDSHKTLYEYVDGAPLAERTVIERRPGKRSLTYRYRWIEAVPLRDGKGALNVNWLGVSITDETGTSTC